ncbi:MAG: hypothetical protein AAGA70_07015 [Pseudomonadota bacterium]
MTPGADVDASSIGAAGLFAALAVLAAIAWPLSAWPGWLSLIAASVFLAMMLALIGPRFAAINGPLRYTDMGRDIRRWSRILGVVFARTSLVLLPVFLLALVALMALVLPYVAEATGGSGSVPLNGLLAGTIIAFGWLATAMVADFRQALIRDETKRDVMHALRGEIFTFVETLDTWSLEGDRKDAVDRIEQGGPEGDGGEGDYLPFWTQDSAPVVFHAVSANVQTLDARTLEVVIRFYAVYTDYCSAIEDSRSEFGRSLPPERQKNLVAMVLSRRANALSWGLAALVALNEALEVQDKALRRKEKDGFLVNPEIMPVPPEQWPFR